ncbi:hypothetical protein B0A55_05856 [Friedmanniomyces simplex]|uniref:SAC domain-containing protein n=1 Tax=Friedmanniomyces simplex TaxID=329884 RepID=A0A4U0X8R7_9PEZI|nr:hypothetical protein B0A55_05856 [Friedmanniomyces simplex]
MPKVRPRGDDNFTGDSWRIRCAEVWLVQAQEDRLKRRHNDRFPNPQIKHLSTPPTIPQLRANGATSDGHAVIAIRPRGAKAARSTAVILTANALEESDTYIVDRRGDSKNVEYGSLHRYSVPSFHRTGYGRVVGGPPTAKIDRAESSDKYVVFSTVRHEDRERSGRLLGTVRGNTASERYLRVIVPVAETCESDVDADFLPLSGLDGRKRKRDAESPVDAKLGWESADCRSIEGKAGPDDSPGDEDLEFVAQSGEDDLADRLSREVRQENAALVRRTKERSTEVDAWTALIEHQAKVIKLGADAAQLTNGEKRALADVRLSIYHQALRHIGKGKPGHIELELGMLELGKMMWETSKLTAKWMEVLKECPDSITLWTKYLDFVQTNHIAFRYEQCRDVYVRCLKILHGARLGATSGDTLRIGSVQIYVLLRFTTFLRDAGYDELAYAVWEALLEYHFFAPPSVTEPENNLRSLEEYWDSDVPRIGEEGAQGWSHHLQHGEKTARRAKSYARLALDPLQPFASFAEGETRLSSKIHLPATDDDNDAAEDPYRSVMFSDLRSCLEPLVDDMPKRELLSAFLSFMHLPVMPDLDTATQAWQTDQFLHGGVGGPLAHDEDIDGIPNQLMTSFSLFHKAFKQCQTADNNSEGMAFIDRILTQLVSAQPDDEILGEYCIASKLAFFPDEAAKAAKRLLKSRPSSLQLYNSYALIEAQLRRGERAAEVWTAALNLSRDFEDAKKDNAVLLWHSWTLTLLHPESGRSKALRCLLAMCDGNPSSAGNSPDNATVSASQRLRMTQACETGFERLIYSKKAELAVLYAECHMWFTYLADGEDLVSTIEIRRKYSARLARHGLTAVEELLLQAQAHLTALHIGSHCPYKPAILRVQLAENLRSFPDNSILLQVYTQIGAQTRIDDRLRASLYDDPVTGPNATVIGWSFAIAQELRRCTSSETSGATANSVRSLFSRALRAPDSKVKHSLVLWRRWFAFELPAQQPTLLLSETQRQQVMGRPKQVFLDGLRCLPWCKAWVIMGLRVFAKKSGMTGSELRQVYDVLGERELRVSLEYFDREYAGPCEEAADVCKLLLLQYFLPLTYRSIRCAAADGLFLHPIDPRESNSKSTCISYGGNGIGSAERTDDNGLHAKSIEAHGIVGLLNLVASSYLIAITGCDQVAQIKGRPIYAIRDVTLIPLSSQTDAERAITQAQKALKQSGTTTTGEEVEESDAGEDAELEHVVGESEPAPEAAALEPPKKGVLKKSATLVKGVCVG